MNGQDKNVQKPRSKDDKLTERPQRDQRLSEVAFKIGNLIQLIIKEIISISYRINFEKVPCEIPDA